MTLTLTDPAPAPEHDLIAGLRTLPIHTLCTLEDALVEARSLMVLRGEEPRLSHRDRLAAREHARAMRSAILAAIEVRQARLNARTLEAAQ